MKSYVYICNNFIRNKVHSETILNLSKKYNDVNHYIFVPYSDKNSINRNNIYSHNIYVEYIYVFKFLRFFPIIKSLAVFFLIFHKGLKKNINWKSAKILAYTFWSDGVVALYFNIFFKIPFSVFVRVTDTSIFFKYGLHLKYLLYLIGKKAKFIFFPSLVLKEKYCQYSLLYKNKNKNIFIPNSINNFWLDNVYYYDNLSIKNKKIIFVGDFNENKNLLGVFNACSYLYPLRKDFQLEFVGGKIEEFKSLCSVNHLPDWVVITEKICKEQLLFKYRESNILLVPSFSETFGMVYIEAISQGCFVIHSKNQGIEYLYKNEFSFSVDPSNFQEISILISQLLDKDFQLDSISLKEKLKNFSASEVINLYTCFFG